MYKLYAYIESKRATEKLERRKRIHLNSFEFRIQHTEENKYTSLHFIILNDSLI